MGSVIIQEINSVDVIKREVYKLDTGRYEELYKCKYATIRRAGLRIFKNTFVVENIVQDAFLKLWNFRDKITSDDHARAFLLLQVRWDCYRHFSNAASCFHRELKLLDELPNYDAVYHIIEPEPYDLEEDELAVSRLRKVTGMLGMLSDGRMKSIFKAHYVDCLTHKLIAVRYGISVTAVTQELQKAVALLKNMVVKPEQMFGENHDGGVSNVRGKSVRLYPVEGLSEQRSAIYHLRTVEKCSFDRIAACLCIPVAEAQKQYVEAWKVVSWLKKEKDKKDKVTAKRRVNAFIAPATGTYVPALRTA